MKDDCSEDKQDESVNDINYTRFRMPINKITEEFQQFIEHKVTLNFPRANIIVASEKDVQGAVKIKIRS